MSDQLGNFLRFLGFLENLNCIIKMHEIVIAPSEKFWPLCDILFVQNSKKENS